MISLSLVETLRKVLSDPSAASFQLMGEDLMLVTGASLRPAAEAYERELARSVPHSLRERFEAEQAAFCAEAHRWLRLYNRSLGGRVRGYLALGRLSGFEYPWPVVAVLGICQVMEGMARNDVYGLVGRVAGRLGWDALERLSDGSIDVLRRTNRGIFADSVPIVLLALRAHELRADGQAELADAILAGPLPPVMDEQSRALARALFDGLAIADGAERFAALARLTLTHFGREQAVFSHQMRSGRARPGGQRRDGGGPPALVRWLTRQRSVLAPAVEPGLLGRRLVFRPFALPEGFAMRDHEARVEAFGRAFVRSVTGDLEDYRTAARWVTDRFGAPPPDARFAAGPAPRPDAGARP